MSETLFLWAVISAEKSKSSIPNLPNLPTFAFFASTTMKGSKKTIAA